MEFVVRDAVLFYALGCHTSWLEYINIKSYSLYNFMFFCNKGVSLILLNRTMKQSR